MEKWILSEPKNPKPYGLIAEMYLLEGNQEKAIEALERILEIIQKRKSTPHTFGFVQKQRRKGKSI